MNAGVADHKLVLSRSRPLFIAWSFFSVISIAVIGLVLRNDWIAFVLVVALGALTFGPVGLRLYTRTFNLAEPGIWFALYYFANFGVRRVYLAISGSQRFAGLMPSEMQGYYLDLALFYAVVGLVAFWLGYTSRFGSAMKSKVPTLPNRWNRTMAWRLSLACIVVGWFIRIAFMYMTSGGVVNWIVAPGNEVLLTGYARLLTAIATIGIFSSFVYLQENGNWRKWLIFGIALAFEFAYKFLNGWRSGLLFLPLGLMVVHYLHSDREHSTNIRFLAGTSGFIGLFALAFPALSVIRYATPQSSIAGPGSGLTLIDVVGKVSKRLHGLDSLALIVYSVPNKVPYTYGKDLWLIFAAWIPRAIWPEKPIINLGTRFQQMVVNPDATVQYGISTSLPGSFYWKFGPVGIIGGMLIIGVLWRFLHEYLVEPRDNVSNFLIVGVIFPIFFTMAGGTLIGLFTHTLFEAGMAVAFSLLLASSFNLRK